MLTDEDRKVIQMNMKLMGTEKALHIGEEPCFWFEKFSKNPFYPAHFVNCDHCKAIEYVQYDKFQLGAVPTKTPKIRNLAVQKHVDPSYDSYDSYDTYEKGWNTHITESTEPKKPADRETIKEAWDTLISAGMVTFSDD